VGALDGAAADVEGRGEPAIDAEEFGSGGGADDVDDSVDGADFMEVDALDGDGMDGGFGFAEELEGADCALLYGLGEGGVADDAEDYGEGAVGLVGVLVIMVVRVIVRVLMRVRVDLARAVSMLVLLSVGMLVGVAVAVRGEDVDLGADDAAAGDFAGFEAGAYVEDRGDGGELVEGHAGIDEGA